MYLQITQKYITEPPRILVGYKTLTQICDIYYLLILAARFRARSDRPWGPPSLLYNGHQILPVGKAAGAWHWPPPPDLTPRLKKE